MLGKLKQAGMQVNEVDQRLHSSPPASRSTRSSARKCLVQRRLSIARSPCVNRPPAPGAPCPPLLPAAAHGDGPVPLRTTAHCSSGLSTALMVVLAPRSDAGCHLSLIGPPRSAGTTKSRRCSSRGSPSTARRLPRSARAHRLPGFVESCLRWPAKAQGRDRRADIGHRLLRAPRRHGGRDHAYARLRHARERASRSRDLAPSVIPISSVLIVIAELTYLIDLISDSGTSGAIALDTSLSDGLH